MSDEEWAFFAPFLVENRACGGRPPSDHRKILDGVFWIARTGSPWRDLPDQLGNWNSVFRQYRRWTEAGVWDLILSALAESDIGESALQMIDSTIIRAHHCAAGGKGGFRETVLAVRAAVSRPRSIHGQTHRASA